MTTIQIYTEAGQSRIPIEELMRLTMKEIFCWINSSCNCNLKRQLTISLTSCTDSDGQTGKAWEAMIEKKMSSSLTRNAIACMATRYAVKESSTRPCANMWPWSNSCWKHISQRVTSLILQNLYRSTSSAPLTRMKLVNMNLSMLHLII